MKFIHEEDNYTLLIYEVLPEDAGSYACVAINSVGKATCTATLNVESMLKQIKGLKDSAGKWDIRFFLMLFSVDDDNADSSVDDDDESVDIDYWQSP